MRDLFINLMEKLIHVIVVIAGIGIVIGAVVAAMNPPPGVPGIAMALGILIGGALYLIIFAGFVYLGLGIYQNTRRTAEAVERMGGR